MPNLVSISPTKPKDAPVSQRRKCRCRGAVCSHNPGLFSPSAVSRMLKLESTPTKAKHTQNQKPSPRDELSDDMDALNLEGTGKMTRKRSRSLDTRLIRSDGAVPKNGVKFDALTPSRCSNCGSPMDRPPPRKRQIKSQKRLDLDDEVVRRDASSFAFEVVKLSPKLQDFIAAKNAAGFASPSLSGTSWSSASPTSPFNPPSTTITPERLNKLGEIGLGADATRVSGEFEISGCFTPPLPVPPSPSPPRPPLGPSPESTAASSTSARRKRQLAAVKSLDSVFEGRKSTLRHSLSTASDRLVPIAERSPVKREALGVDVLSKLAQTGNFQIVINKVLSYVDEDDLCALSCVSRVHKRCVFGDPDANRRRKEFLRLKRMWLRSPEAENSRMLRGYLRSPSTIRPRNIVELAGYLNKGSPRPEPVQSSVRRSLVVSNSPAPRPPNLRGAHTHPRAQENRFWAFYNEGKKLSASEHLTPCPRCDSPACVSRPPPSSSSEVGNKIARCTKASCGFTFCPMCHIGTPARCCRRRSLALEERDVGAGGESDDEGGMPLRSWGSAPSIGSRKSKRNLRRLLDK